MALHAEPDGPSAAAVEFRAALDVLGLTQGRIAELFNVSPRHVRRWKSGSRCVPRAVGIVCNLLTAGAVTLEQVEQSAVPAPARTNGAEPEPLVPLEETPEQSTLACAKTAPLAILALSSNSCRWPIGDPQCSDFRFCGAVTEKGPYCVRHARLAYLAPRTGGGHGVRVGFVAHGRQPRPQQAPAHDRPSTPSAFSATGTARAPSSRAAFPDSARLPA